MEENLIKKFWSITSDGNPLPLRFTSLLAAQEYAESLCKVKANRVCYILEVVECVKADTTTEIDIVNYRDLEQTIAIPMNEVSIIGVTFTDDSGEFIDLSTYKIQLLVLPNEFSSEAEAIYSEIVDGTAEMHEVEFTVGLDVTAHPLNAWYKINIIEDGVATRFQQGDFKVIE